MSGGHTIPIPDMVLDEIAARVADRLRDLLAQDTGTPWMTMPEAVEYTRIPNGTFRHMVADGRIPSHGGRRRLFHRSEVDQALLGCSR